MINGWVKDSIDSEGYVDVEILKDDTVLQKSKVYVDGKSLKELQVALPGKRQGLSPKRHLSFDCARY